MPSELGYWSPRAFAQPIRLLLGYAGEDFVDKRYYTKGSAPNWDRSEWFSVKHTFGLDFPNLPYYIDENVKLSQTFTILKYLGRKHNLAPRNEEEEIRVDLIEAEAMDLRTRWGFLCYGDSASYNVEEFNKRKPEYVEKTLAKLQDISAFLGDRQYFAGDHLTYIDFLMYELLDAQLILEPTILDKVPNLRAYHDRIEQLPALVAYFKSDKFVKAPLNGPMAAFGTTL